MNSRELYEEALSLIPGGVNSPVRAFGSVGGTPPFISHGKGAMITDVEGKSYIDYVLSWGPLILGHAPDSVVSEVTDAISKGSSFGAPTPLEVEIARVLVDSVDSIEKVRLVNSGTEATMSAIRLARGFTGRDKIVKFQGCYHGHADSLLTKAGSGMATLGLPMSPGVTPGTVQDTLTCAFNSLSSVEGTFKSNPDQIAAIIVEPVAGNMGVVPPVDGFLQGLRALTLAHGSLLIFDEVMTGFRVAFGGAQALYGVKPDITCLGKVIGGGFPVGAYGGRADIMDRMAPAGPIYQAGTLSGNPVACRAGLATLKALAAPGVFDGIVSTTKTLVDGMAQAAREAEIPIVAHRVGTMFSMFFGKGPITDWDSVAASGGDVYKTYFHTMLQEGVYLAPSAFEAAFVSSAHGPVEIEKTLAAHRKALAAVKGGS